MNSWKFLKRLSSLDKTDWGMKKFWSDEVADYINGQNENGKACR